jgi:hypothetical protein
MFFMNHITPEPGAAGGGARADAPQPPPPTHREMQEAGLNLLREDLPTTFGRNIKEFGESLYKGALYVTLTSITFGFPFFCHAKESDPNFERKLDGDLLKVIDATSQAYSKGIDSGYIATLSSAVTTVSSVFALIGLALKKAGSAIEGPP